jgi:putative methyltransferase (TIGR04325 family)
MMHFLVRLYRRFRYMRYGWFGHYASWQEAQQQCTGYDDGAILQKILAGAQKVKNGEAVWERDGVLLDHIEYSWPLLAHLLWIGRRQGNRLSVLDFGGGLGTAWFQNRGYLQVLDETQWSVAEQAAFVSAGRAHIAGNGLQFYYTPEEALADRGPHDVFMMGCVLPYLEKPYAFLQKTIDKAFPYIIIENTYFNPAPGDRLTIQKVPPFYYEASYPAWFLDYDKVKALLLTRYELVEAYTNDTFLYLYGRKINYRGLVMKLRS